MATASVANARMTVNQHSVGHAIRQLRLAYATDARKLAALGKVVGNLWACIWAWDAQKRMLMVESATRTGRVHYHVQHGQCECQAAAHGRQCWHAMAWEVLLAAEAQPPVPQKAYAKIVADANAALF
jgi:hypothetical protein